MKSLENIGQMWIPYPHTAKTNKGRKRAKVARKQRKLNKRKGV